MKDNKLPQTSAWIGASLFLLLNACGDPENIAQFEQPLNGRTFAFAYALGAEMDGKQSYTIRFTEEEHSCAVLEPTVGLFTDNQVSSVTLELNCGRPAVGSTRIDGDGTCGADPSVRGAFDKDPFNTIAEADSGMLQIDRTGDLIEGQLNMHLSKIVFGSPEEFVATDVAATFAAKDCGIIRTDKVD